MTDVLYCQIFWIGSNLIFLWKIIEEKQYELQPYSPFTISKLIKFMSKLQNYSIDLLMVSINKLYEVNDNNKK
jgi:hypothetical protein